MCMIFDRFESRVDAERFARDVAVRFKLQTDVWDSHDEMDAAFAAHGFGPVPEGRLVDFFPSDLTGPIALVERTDYAVEETIETLVSTYHGTYAGT